MGVPPGPHKVLRLPCPIATYTSVHRTPMVMNIDRPHSDNRKSVAVKNIQRKTPRTRCFRNCMEVSTIILSIGRPLRNAQKFPECGSTMKLALTSHRNRSYRRRVALMNSATRLASGGAVVIPPRLIEVPTMTASAISR